MVEKISSHLHAGAMAELEQVLYLQLYYFLAMVFQQSRFLWYFNNLDFYGISTTSVGRLAQYEVKSVCCCPGGHKFVGPRLLPPKAKSCDGRQSFRVAGI
jgi:hypothetical protein